ncbi:MAG: glycosyltransferase [Clostridia bacterium]|nr:glycosyltransferase [Clostridia bacterium]
MRILITTDLFTTRTNGVVTSTHNLIHDLRRRGHDVRVITFSKTKESYVEDGVYYIKSASLEWIYPELRMPTSRAGKFVKEIVAWGPEVIHTQCEFLSFGFAKRIARRTGAPIIHTYHTMYEDYVGYVIPFKRFGRWCVRRFVTRRRLRRVHTIIAPTAKVRDYLVDRCKVKNNTAVIPSGICLDKHKTRLTVEERREGRAAFGFDDSHTVLINLGRLGTEKNLEEVIEYFSRVKDKYDGARLLIVGGGPARESLDKLVSELGIGDRVVFAGMVDPDTVARYYQLGDLFVCASTSETQGLTYIEAAANCLPLLCRNDPCFEGVVIDGENGYRYESFEEYAEKLDLILSDPDWCKRAGARSGEISNLFDRTVFGGSVESLYRLAAYGEEKKDTAQV